MHRAPVRVGRRPCVRYQWAPGTVFVPPDGTEQPALSLPIHVGTVSLDFKGTALEVDRPRSDGL